MTRSGDSLRDASIANINARARAVSIRSEHHCVLRADRVQHGYTRRPPTVSIGRWRPMLILGRTSPYPRLIEADEPAEGCASRRWKRAMEGSSSMHSIGMIAPV